MSEDTYGNKVGMVVGGDAMYVKNGGKFGRVAGATITVSAEESGGEILVTIQLTDAFAADLDEPGAVFAYLSDDADGSSIAATAPDGGVDVRTDGVAIPLVADKAFQLISEADGDIDLAIQESSADTFYLVLVIGDVLVISGAITFAG